MNDFTRIDEPEVYHSVKPPGVNQSSIDGFNFLIERRKQLYNDSEIRLLQVRLTISECSGRTPGQLALI